MTLQTDCSQKTAQMATFMYSKAIIALLDACLPSYVPHEKNDERCQMFFLVFFSSLRFFFFIQFFLLHQVMVVISLKF
jgi:hypothetical protein